MKQGDIETTRRTTTRRFARFDSDNTTVCRLARFVCAKTKRRSLNRLCCRYRQRNAQSVPNQPPDLWKYGKKTEFDLNYIIIVGIFCKIVPN
jgi:hypothetical protein